MNTLIATITLLSGALVVYHHLIYPLLMRLGPRKAVQDAPANSPQTLPCVDIIIPAYNEGRWIADKIRNLASLDYPEGLLTVHIGFDGCTDDSVSIAAATLAEPICEQLNCKLHVYEQNRGKVALLNQLISEAQAEIVALSDVSALLSIDALKLAAAHFKDANIGVVNSHYLLMQCEDKGEAAYWQYQNKVKVMEASMGTPMGTHGALYLFRRELFSPLPGDTINDDFILPMSIAAEGYQGVQENRIHAVELEPTSASQNFKRRMRIGAGNLQQVIRLKHLLNPAKGKISLLFWSGKTLRVACGALMLIALAGSLYLAPGSMLFALLAAVQLVAWGLAILGLIVPACRRSRVIQALSYLITGHMAILAGSIRYLLGLENGRWKRVSK